MNPDGTLKGYEFPKGYHPLEDDTPEFVRHQGEDLIDFPVSSDWVSLFAHQGITTDYPSDFYLNKKSRYPTVVTNNDSIENITERLYNRLAEIDQEVNKLKERLGGEEETYYIK